MKLYELTNEYAHLVEQYYEAESDDERELIIADIIKASEDVSLKGENYARFIKNLEASIKAYGDEMRRLAAMKKAAENTVARLKENLHFSMESAGLREIPTNIGKWRVQRNPPKVLVTDIWQIPGRFLTAQEPKVEKDAIMTEFKQTGEIIDGVEIVQTEGVRFR